MWSCEIPVNRLKPLKIKDLLKASITNQIL